MGEEVGMRCPLDSQRQFGKVLGDDRTTISANLLEFSCDKCRRRTGKVTLHRFDLSGQFVETVTK